MIRQGLFLRNSRTIEAAEYGSFQPFFFPTKWRAHAGSTVSDPENARRSGQAWRIKGLVTDGDTNDDSNDIKHKSSCTGEEEDGPVQCQRGERGYKESKWHGRLRLTVNPFVMNELHRHS